MTVSDWFSLTSPQGPDTPFGSPGMVIMDLLRILIVILAILIAVMAPIILHRMRTIGQRARILGCTGLCFMAAINEYRHLGDYTSWRFAVDLVCVVAVAWGYYSAIEWENSAQYHTNHIHPGE